MLPTDTAGNAGTTTSAEVVDVIAKAGGFLIYVGSSAAENTTFVTTWQGPEPLIEDVDAHLEGATLRPGMFSWTSPARSIICC